MDSHRVIYDAVYDSLLSMPSRLVLAQANYQTDFMRQHGHSVNWDYKEIVSNQRYETIIVGEILPTLCGTRFSAKGNHFVGSHLKVIRCLCSGSRAVRFSQSTSTTAPALRAFSFWENQTTVPLNSRTSSIIR